MKTSTKLWVTTLILILLDQITKHTLKNITKDYRIIAINYIQNTGISFGMLQGSSTIIIAISIVFLYILYKERKAFKNKEIYAILIIAGIIGNLIDRIFLGYVIDFIDLKWWPIFNFADSYIFLGVFGYITKTLIEKYKPKKKKNIHKKTRN